MSGPFPSSIRARRLENEIQAQLDGAVAARAQHGVEGSVVWGGTATTECTHLGWIGECPLAIATGGSIRIGEIGMVENVESFHAELHLHPFPEFEALADRQVDIAEAGIAEDVSTHGTEGPKTIGNQHGIADHVAIACRVQQEL